MIGRPSALALFLILTCLAACGGEEGVCFGRGTDGRDSCASLGTKRSCAAESRTWTPYLPGDKAKHHWETSGVRTCNARGYTSCGPGGCSR